MFELRNRSVKHHHTAEQFTLKKNIFSPGLVISSTQSKKLYDSPNHE